MKHRLSMINILLIITALFFTGSTHADQAGKAASSQQDKPLPTNGFELELARLNQSINTLQKRSIDRPNSWLPRENLSIALLNRGRLTGNVEDYVAAQIALQSAFDISGELAGPTLTRASLNYSMHRLPEVEVDLTRAEAGMLPSQETLRTIAGLRGDVLLHSGRYVDAKAMYEQTEEKYPNSSTAINLAFFNIALAEFDQAESWFKIAEDRVVGRSAYLRAWLKLQLGILDLEQGQWKQAYHHYDKARSLFPGHWLIEEHIAEIEALLGYARKAEKKYRDLIERTDSPVLMTALADILQDRDNASDSDEAAALTLRAKEKLEQTMVVAPELMSGHALDFFLQSDEVELALTLALEDYRLRPGGTAAISLAQAYALTDQPSEALSLIEKVLATPYRSAELHATAATLYGLLGQDKKTNEQESKAIALHPMAIDDIEWLLARLSAKS